MSSNINSATRMTRKEHYCFGCGCVIPAKSLIDIDVCQDEGKIYTLYWCDPCRGFYLNHHYTEEVEEGEIGELRREYERNIDRTNLIW